MTANPPSRAIRQMLVDREIALWSAHHYNTVTGRPKKADPVYVCLVTPQALDRMFYGQGPDTDSAVLNALAKNSGLNTDANGVTGALARLENAVHNLQTALIVQNEEHYGLDYDIPF